MHKKSLLSVGLNEKEDSSFHKKNVQDQIVAKGIHTTRKQNKIQGAGSDSDSVTVKSIYE